MCSLRIVIFNFTCFMCCILRIECQLPEIYVCENPLKGQSCSITCNTTALTDNVEFLLGSSSQGSCIYTGVSSLCGPGLNQSGTVTELTISTLSRASHEGDWSCKYGSTNSASKKLIVKTEPTTKLITQTFPEANNTVPATSIDISGTCYCIYPSTTNVEIYYKEELTGNLQYLQKIPAASIASTLNPGHSCAGYEYEITVSNYTLENTILEGLRNVYFEISFNSYRTMDVGPFLFKVKTKPNGSTSESTIMKLSTDIGTTTNLETSSKFESLSSTQTSVFLLESTTESNILSGSTELGKIKPETSTAPVTTSSSGLSEEMIIIISTVSAVGGISLIVIIVVVLLCCRRSAAKNEKKRKKHGNLHIKNDKNKDLNSNFKHSQTNKHHAHSGKKIKGGTDLHQKHPKNDILYGGRRPTRDEHQRSKNYHQQKYFPRNQHHYRNQNSAYYLPNTDPRNMMFYQRYPGIEYSEDMSGYSRAGPYRMHQFYPASYSSQDRYTEDGLEKRIGHRRGEYEDYWGDTLY